MDVQKKFILQIAVLGVIVIILGILVFISSTRDPIQGRDPESPDLTVSFDDFSGFDSESDETVQDDDVPIGVLTVKEAVHPAQLVSESKVALLNEQQVGYRIRMTAGWSEHLHPGFYPEGAHVSPFVAWTHTIDDSVFQDGRLASPGLQQLAETGATDALVDEITVKGIAGEILDFAVSERIDAPGTSEETITLDAQTQKISIVGKIGPSPDWFVAIHNLPLFQSGFWLDYKQVDAVVYDAGTDSGTSFESENRAANPREGIAELEGVPIFPVVSFEFIKL